MHRRMIWIGILAVAGAAAYLALADRNTAPAARQPPGPTAQSSAAPAAGSGGRHGAAPIAVLTAVAERKDVPITRHYVGWVEPIASVAVLSQIDGVIVEQPVSEGQSVTAGDVLFRLDDRALQATIAKDRATIAKDQASLDQLNADLKRIQALASGNDPSVSAQLVQQQQSLVNEAAAVVQSDKAELQADEVQLGYATVTAPIAGRIGVINDTVGARIRTSDTTPVLTITQMAPVRVSFSVSETDLEAFRNAIGAGNPPVTRAVDPSSGKTLSEGRATFVDSVIDKASGTVTVKADFANADGTLWPGQYVNVDVDIGVHRQATVVPQIAVQLQGSNTFVFLANSNGTVTHQPVTVTASIGSVALIGEGVKPGDHVVVEGQLRLTDGAAIHETVASAATPATVKAD